jgi:gamma-glutamylaminecyclotransferase
MPHLVFVFGTLKEGFPNFATNKGARVGGDFITVERYPLHLVGERFSPWLIDVAGEGEQVVGQVFEVDPSTLDAMDLLERITEADGYRRVTMQVRAVSSEPGSPGSTLGVHAYVKEPAHFRPEDARLGPLREYTQEHAALYRGRRAPGQLAEPLAAHPE